MSEPQWEGNQAPPPDEEFEFKFDFRDQLRILRKRLWLIVGSVAVATAVGAVLGFTQPRVYRASGTLHIDTTTPRVLGDVKEVVDLGAGDYWSSKEFFETQYKILTSRDVLQRVVEKFGLDRDVAFLDLDDIRDPDRLAREMARADAAAVLRKRLLVDPVKNSQLVSVSVEDTEPSRAAALANAVMDAYIERNLDRRLETSRAASDWLGEQMRDLKGKLESSELALYAFKRDQDILSTSMEDRQNIISQRLIALNDSLTKVITRKVELEAALTETDTAKKLLPDDPLWAASLARVADDKLIGDLQRELAKQESEVAGIRENYLDKHPKRMAAEQRLADLKAKVAREMETVVGSVRSQYREAATAERKLADLIEGVKREAFELNKKEIDYKKLQREQQNNQRLYELVLTRLKESDLTSLLKANNVRKLEVALEPQKPVRPRRLVILVLSFIFGTLLGLGLTYLLEFFDRTLKNEEDVERVLGVPFLGMVPSVAAEGANKKARSDDPSRDLFVFTHPKSPAAECARAIRTNLLFMSPERSLRRILVTSSSPQEGKTTTAIHTAIAMAQAGSRVLVVDADMRRPRVHRAFGISNEVGLSTVIVGEAKIGDAIRATAVADVWVMPCGPVPPNPAELLHTERFRSVIDDLSARFDLVIFDSPPLMAVADAAVLATGVDGVMLVTRFRKTTRDFARHALRSLRDVKATVLGAVMNDVDLQSREYDYYYARRYGYYDYADDGETVKV